MHWLNFSTFDQMALEIDSIHDQRERESWLLSLDVHVLQVLLHNKSNSRNSSISQMESQPLLFVKHTLSKRSETS